MADSKYKIAITADGTKAKREISSLDKTFSAFGMAGAVAVGNLASEITTELGTALKDATVDTVIVGSTFEEQMSKVAAISGVSGEKLDQLTAKARLMGETTKFSGTESAQALEFLSMAGFNADQAMQALPGTLDLAAAAGIELASAADIASNALTGMQLPISDLGRVNDVLANTISTSNTNMEMMAESLKYVAPLAASTGTSIEQVASMIGLLGNAGIQGSMAGTSLKKAMSTLLSPTDSVKSKFSELGITISGNLVENLKNLEAAGASTADIMEIFGERAGISMVALLAQGTNALEDFTKANENAQGRAKEMAEIMNDNLAGDFKILLSTLESLQISLFDTFSPDLRNIVQQTTAFIAENKAMFIALAKDGVEFTKTSFEAFGIFLDAVLPESFSTVRGAANLFNDTLETILKTINTLYTGLQNTVEVLASLVDTPMNAIANWWYGTGDLYKSVQQSADKLFTNIAKNTEEGAKNNQFLVESFAGVRDSINAVGDANNQVKNESEDMTDQLEKQAGVQKNLNQEIKKQIEESSKSINNQVEDLKDAVETQNELEHAVYIVADAMQHQESVIDSVTDSVQTHRKSVYELVDSYNNVGLEAEKAIQKVSSFTSLSDVASRWNQAGGFTVYGPGGSSQSSYEDNSYSSYQNTTKSQISEVERTLSDLARLEDQVADYIFDQQTAETQLAYTQRSLMSSMQQLSQLQDEDVSERISLYSQMFGQIKQIDSLSKTVQNNQQKTANNLASLYSNLVSSSDEIKELDLLPVDKLEAMQNKFSALSSEVNSLDFSDLSTADQSLINSFVDVGKEYLSAANDVFKSSDNYTQLKTAVTGEFNDIAAKLSGSNGALTSLSGTSSTAAQNVSALSNNAYWLGYNSSTASTNTDSLAGKVSGLASESDTASTDTGNLSSKILGLAGISVNASDTTDKLSNSLTETSSPLNTANSNFTSIATNTELAFKAISNNALELKKSLEEDRAFVEQQKQDLANIQTFSHYAEVGNQLQAISSAGTLMNAVGASSSLIEVKSGGQQAYIKEKTGTKTTYYDKYGSPVGYVEKDLSGQIVENTLGSKSHRSHKTDNIYGYRLYTSGQKSDLLSDYKPFANGAWDIPSVQRGILHAGEMVIPSRDAEPVREFLSATGRSKKYGVSGTGDIFEDNITKAQGSQIIKLLAEISNKLNIPKDDYSLDDLINGFARQEGVAG